MPLERTLWQLAARNVTALTPRESNCLVVRELDGDSDATFASTSSQVLQPVSCTDDTVLPVL